MIRMVKMESDGIALSKGLAWSILITLIAAIGGGGLWVGRTVSTINTEMTGLKIDVRSIRASYEDDTSDINERLRLLESDRTLATYQISSITSDMKEIKNLYAEQTKILNRIAVVMERNGIVLDPNKRNR